MYYTRKIPEPFQKNLNQPPLLREAEIAVLHAEEKIPQRNHQTDLFPMVALLVSYYFSPQKKDG